MIIVISLLTGVILLWLLLYPISDYFIRFFGPIVRKTASKTMVALTFDDGPDPEYTLAFLKVLAQNNAKATFFLVGRQAAAYPELVRLIREEGHEIALHSQNHRHAYTMLGQTFREVSVCRETVQRIADAPGHWFRPPWGAFNFLTLAAIRRQGLKPVMWSVNAEDWLRGTGPEGIRLRVRERIHPGAVIVLHDHGGEPGAPANTLTALPGILSDLAQQGLRVVSLSQLCLENQEEGVNHGEIHP